MFHVKHTSDQSALTPQAVVEAARSAGVVVLPAEAARIVEHAALVLDANNRMNLTRITEPSDVLTLHIVDSIAFLPHVAPLTGRIVDMGSGAGYPGIPLAILGLNVTLCESVKKKAAFLEETVVHLGLDVPVKPQRAEDLAAAEPASADVVVARAVSATASLLELASPLLRTAGRLIALKGTPDEDELARANVVAPMCGMRNVSRTEYVLPGGERRSVLVYERVGRAHVSLPRRPGSAQRRPLG
jgi:16S rRNA (guanine527-N7)-methyltransferase